MKIYITKIQAMLTAVGIMIGSGIFFKTDDIIKATGNNVSIALVMWIVITIGLIFAGVSIATIAGKTKTNGGFIGYAEEHFGPRVAFVIGWVQIIIYVPFICGILSIVLISYLSQLSGWNLSSELLILAAMVLVILVFTWNILSTRIAALVSVSATYIKLIPLVFIAVVGFISDINFSFLASDSLAPTIGATAYFAPLLAMAFSFDGWISVGSLSMDMKDPKKELPFVFFWSIIITGIIYIIYFLGITMLMDSETIVSLGNGHVGVIAQNLFGILGEKVILVFVIISVLGTLNGMILTGARYVKKMADDKILFNSNYFSTMSKHDTPQRAYYFTFISVVVALFLYYLRELELPIISDIVLEDIPLTVNALFILMLITVCYKYFKNKEVGIFKGIIAPSFAILLQGAIIIAFFVQAPNIIIPIIYLVIVVIIVVIGYMIHRKRINKYIEDRED